jgi:hypothetical protein
MSEPAVETRSVIAAGRPLTPYICNGAKLRTAMEALDELRQRLGTAA